MVDARDRRATAMATTRSELILEAFDRRLESLGRRLEGLLALRDRLETVSEGCARSRHAPGRGTPPPDEDGPPARCADSVYTAFENRYRGDREEIRERLASYAELFAGLGPVADLGCGRGEFLDALRERDIEGLGVESNANAVAECRARGLDVREATCSPSCATEEGEPRRRLRGPGGRAPAAARAARAARRGPSRLAPRRPAPARDREPALRRRPPRGLQPRPDPRAAPAPRHPALPRRGRGLHGRAGRDEVARSSPPRGSQPVPTDGLPARTAETLNENVARLNALLYGPLEYALLARR